MTFDLRKTLLAGTAIVAVGAYASAAQAADAELAGATGTPTDLSATLAADADSIINDAATNNDAGELDIDDGETVLTINNNNDGILTIYDSVNDTANGDTLTVTTFVDITSGTTLNLIAGASEEDGNAADTISAEETIIAVGTTLGDNGATTLTRGGVLSFRGADDVGTAAAFNNTLTVAGNTLLTTVNVEGGAAGANNGEGAAVTGTFGDSSSDTFNVTGLTVTGGAADATTNEDGGAATFTSTAVATVGTGNIVVTGGAGADAGAGGAASATFSNGLTVSGAGTFDVTAGAAANAGAGGAASATVSELTMGTGTLTVTGGDDATTGNGGDASLTVTGDATSSGALALVGGTGAGAGVNGDALATFGGDVTFSGITMEAGADGTVSLTLNGSSAQTVTGDIDGASAAEGAVIVNNASGVTFAGKVGDDAGNGIASLTIEKTAGNSSATFKDDVDAAAIVLGGDSNAGDENTATFDTTTQAFTVTGALNGDTTEVDALVVSGDDILTQATAWGGGAGGLDTITISGTATLNSDADITVDDGDATITVGSSAKLDVGAGLVTATGGIANSGTIQLTGTGGITADITGSGTVDVDEDATITGSIAGTSVTVASTKTLDVDAATTLSATTLTLEDDGTDNGNGGTLNFDTNNTNVTVSSNIVTALDGEGSITIEDDAGDTVTFSGNIGSSTLALQDLDVAGAGAQTVEFAKNVFVDAITANDADTLSFTGSTAQTVSGTITSGITNIAANAAVTFNGVLSSMATGTTNAGSSATYNANATYAGAYTNNATATTKVGVGSVLSADSFNDAGTYILNAQDANQTLATADFGSLTDSSNGTTITASNVQINVTGQMVAGANVLFLTGVNLGAATLTDNSLQFTFTVADDGADTDITVTRTTLASLGSATSGNAAAGTTLDGLVASGNTEIQTLLNTLASASSQAEVDDALEAIQPDVGGGNVGAALAVGNSSANVTSSRLASLRNGDVVTGMTTGNVSEGLRVWAQGFGSTAEQDERDNVSGYNADSYGIAVGMDTENAFHNAVVGVGLSYADTEVDSDAANNANTDIDSYQISLYGDYDIDDRTYVNAMAAYSYHDNETTRNPATGLTANGKFDADQFTLRGEVGRDYQHNNTTLTPSFMAHWTNYDAEDYTETGAGGANLTVDSEAINIFELGVGLAAGWEHQNRDGSIVEPELRVGYRYDLVGDEIETTSTFQGGGAAFKSTGADPAQSTFNAGAAVKYYTVDNWEFTANYDFEIKEDFDSHAGFVRAGYKF